MDGIYWYVPWTSRKTVLKKPKGQILETASKARKHKYNFFFKEVKKIVNHKYS